MDSANNPAEKRVFDTVYILFRVAERIRHKALREKIENNAVCLIEQAGLVNKEEFGKTISILEQLLKLGGEIAEIHKDSVQVLIAELNKANSAIAELGKEKLEPINLPKRDSDNPARERVRKESVQLPNLDRQAAILEKIRQIGSCRMKDIQEYFPGTSERTIRYDLGKLVEQGLLERLGTGGPATFYRVKEPRAIQVVATNPEV